MSEYTPESLYAAVEEEARHDWLDNREAEMELGDFDGSEDEAAEAAYYEAEARAEYEAEMAYERWLEDAGERMDPAGYAADREAELFDAQINGEGYEPYEPSPYDGTDNNDLPF